MFRVVDARDAGVHECLAKPISAKSLYARVKVIIDRPRPFVRTKADFGSDRRRRTIAWRSAERRKGAKTAVPTPDPDVVATASLSQEEVEALLRGV